MRKHEVQALATGTAVYQVVLEIDAAAGDICACVVPCEVRPCRYAPEIMRICRPCEWRGKTEWRGVTNVGDCYRERHQADRELDYRIRQLRDALGRLSAPTPVAPATPPGDVR